MKNKLFKFRDNKKIHANFRDKQYFSHYCLSFKIIEKKIQNKSGGNIISGVIVYKLIVIKKTKEIDKHTLFRRFLTGQKIVITADLKLVNSASYIILSCVNRKELMVLKLGSHTA